MPRKFYVDVNGTIPQYHFELTPPPNTALVADRSINILLMKGQYEHRKEEGNKLFDDTRAEIYFDYTDGFYGDVTDPTTLPKVLDLESYLDDVIKYLIRGDWLTAKNVCEGLVAGAVELFTQDFKDELMLKINTFLSENY